MFADSVFDMVVRKNDLTNDEAIHIGSLLKEVTNNKTSVEMMSNFINLQKDDTVSKTLTYLW